MACPTCGATQNVHGDCLVCDAPFGAPHARTVYVRNVGPLSTSAEPPHGGGTAVADRPAPSVVERHLAALPPSYSRRNGPDAVARHLALIARADGGTAIEHSRVGGVDRLTVVTTDRAGLLELLAGTLTVRSLSIEGATAYTRGDGIVIDEIDVAPHRGASAQATDWSAICADLTDAISGGRSPSERGEEPQLAVACPDRRHIPTTVYVHNAPGDRFSKIEVNAADRPGLLYAITRALREQALSVHLAEVETIGALAVDSFYVVDADGERVESANAVANVKAAVIKKIGALDAA